MKKKRLTISALVFCIMLLGFGILGRSQLISYWQSTKYPEQIEFAKECLLLLAEGNELKLREKSTPHATFLRNEKQFSLYKGKVEKVDIETINFSRLIRQQEGDNTFFFVGFSIGDADESSVQLRLQSVRNQLILEEIIFSDSLLTEKWR